MTVVSNDQTDPRCSPLPSLEKLWDAFARELADSLKCTYEKTSEGYRIAPVVSKEADPANEPPSNKSGWGVALKPFRSHKPDTQVEGVASVPNPRELVATLIDRLSDKEDLPNLVPEVQPTTVHEISARLFDAYRVDDGAVHLVGCHLEDSPFLRVTELSGSNDQPVVRHALVNLAGEPVEPSLIESLGLRTTAPMKGRPMTGVTPHGHEHAVSIPFRDKSWRPTALVWAKQVEGRLEFEIGEQSLCAPFADWARTLQAPPVVCPQTGRKTYHLTALEDGQIAAAEEVGVCQRSGRRLLRRDLVACSATGQTVAAELCRICPVSGQAVLEDQFSSCGACNQEVSSVELAEGTCRACREMKKIGTNDQRLAMVLKIYPRLNRYRRWRLGETREAYILQSSRWGSQLRVVLDKETLAILHAAATGWLSLSWRMLLPEEVRQQIG